jgi:ethanolamine-phosphate cytidylyltransferase
MLSAVDVPVFFYQRGDYLIVGVHSDAVVNKRRGVNLPLLNFHERVLSVLGCRFVDDVLLDAPFQITREMISSLRINEVVRGTNTDLGDNGADHEFRYKYAKDAGIFSVVQSPSDFRFQSIVKRVRKNFDAFQLKFDRKMKAEIEFYEEKYNDGRLVQ